MKLNEILEFRKDLFFEGAVQADWFYSPEKAAKVAVNFVFHGKNYFGVDSNSSGKKRIDTITLTEFFAENLVSEHPNPLSLAIADYGTGKSHLAVTLAQLLSGPNYMPDVYSGILKNIESIDKESAERIKANTDGRNLVLVINGMRDFNLHAEILKAAQKSLALYGLSDEPLRKLNRALETANNFLLRNSKQFSLLFEESAAKAHWPQKGDSLITRLSNELMSSDEAFEIVDTVYERINGSHIQWDEGLSAASILETLITEYCGMSGVFDHVILLFDEFGRYLEYASSTQSGKSGDSALQQIFEVSQNANGVLQVINFIQSDIKSYLQRVDQTKNISRYIGRYDASSKYYISSNLETVFANLIQRKDQSTFNSTVVKWQESNEEKWKELFTKLNAWLPTRGLWKDYKLFRKVIVEGIFPMHPLSTFMLTQLSDYLQNRSSLTLCSRYIEESGTNDFDGFASLVMPTALMAGDLYTEMLAAEQDGKQPSQHCIRYDNVIRKFGDKLSHNSLVVLRANLIMRILRFRANDRDEVEEGLSLCSGLSRSEVLSELKWLEDEYAVLGYDEHACCFDFMEESNGASDFKVLKKRLIASATIPADVLSNIKIQEIAGVLEPLTTNYGNQHKISTNEWQFKQELYPIEALSEARISGYIEDWRNATNSVTPKGRIIWLYLNKDTNSNYLDSAKKLAAKIKGMPILLFLLNDDTNRLVSALTEYLVLDNLDDGSRSKFARYFEADFSQAESNLRDEFESLKKKRQLVSFSGIEGIETRLPIYLTSVFESIYPDSIPFWFDGFVTKGNNVGGKGGVYYCSIVKMLFSNAISYDSIHNFPSDVRNRIEALLLSSATTSWKCISSDYKITPPFEPKSKKVYEEILSDLNSSSILDCGKVFGKYTMPPYGISEDIIVMMIAVLCANLSYCLRISYCGEATTLSVWKEQVVLKDKKIDLDVIRKSSLLIIDVDASTAKFVKLFEKIRANKTVWNIPALSTELERLTKAEDLPDELEPSYLLAKKTIDIGLKAIGEINDCFNEVADQMGKANAQYDLWAALSAFETLKTIPLQHALIENGFDFDDITKSKIIKAKDEITKFINAVMPYYLENEYCNSLAGVNSFRNHQTRVAAKLREFGFAQFASKVEERRDRELEHQDEIRSREELRSDCQKFLAESQITAYSSFMTISEYIQKGSSLQERIAKYKSSLGSDREKISADIALRITELNKFKNVISKEMSDLWDDVYEIASIDDIRSIIQRIDAILVKGLSETDVNDFQELRETLSLLLKDLTSLVDQKQSRDGLEKEAHRLLEFYEEKELDFDVITIINDIWALLKNEQSEMDKKWSLSYLNIDGMDRPQMHQWLERVAIPPAYLSPETLSKLALLKEKILQSVKDGQIEDVLYYFNKLDPESKIQCLELLKKNS